MLKSLKSKPNRLSDFGMSFRQDSTVFGNVGNMKRGKQTFFEQNFDASFEAEKNIDDTKSKQSIKTQLNEEYQELDEKQSFSKNIRNSQNNKKMQNLSRQNNKKILAKLIMFLLILGSFLLLMSFSRQNEIREQDDEKYVKKLMSKMKLQIMNNHEQITIRKSDQNNHYNNVENQLNLINNHNKNQLTQNIQQKNQQNDQQPKQNQQDQLLYDQTQISPRTGKLRHSFPQAKSTLMLEKLQLMKEKEQQIMVENTFNQKIMGQNYGEMQQQSVQSDINSQNSLAKLPVPNFPPVINHGFQKKDQQIHQQSYQQKVPQPQNNDQPIQSPKYTISIFSPSSMELSPQTPSQQIPTMTCSQYIEKERKNKGMLYRFAAQNRIIRETSHVEYFTDQLTTQITREKFSQAVDLLELIHHVDKEGKVVAQDDPCYSAEFFKTKMNDIMQRQHERFNNQYGIDSYHKKQLRFCIVVNSYNNAHNGLIYRNIDSILQQNYTNYHVVYTDDKSPDLTGQWVNKYLIQKNVSEQKFKVKINQQKVGMMENIYNAITYDCQEGQIAVMLDGDDSFIGTNVLSLLNAVYQREKIAIMWNNFLQIEENSRVMMGFSRDVDDYQKMTKNFRQTNKFASSHLKSFYVDLFKKIKPDDLKHDDTKKFFGGASDTAMMFAMIQMAYPNYRYIPEILYEYRFDTGQVGMTVNRNAQQKALQKIAFLKPYEQLKDFSFIQRAIENAKTL